VLNPLPLGSLRRYPSGRRAARVLQP